MARWRTVAIVLAASLLSAPVAAERPNLVVVMVDDLDSGSTEALLAAGLLPNIQREIVDRGVRFRQALVTDALCCPSRATFLTGQYAHNHGVRGNGPPLGGVAALRDASTLATWLRHGGYRTGFVGKYLNGYGGAVAPTYVPPGWDDWQALIDGAGMYGYSINDNGRLLAYGHDPADYQTDVLARRAVDFLLAAAAPFFVWINPSAPHFEPAPADWELQWRRTVRPAPRHAGTVAPALPKPPSLAEPDVRDKPSWLRQLPLLASAHLDDLERQYRDRLASMRAVDDLVARVVEALTRTGQLSRTAIIFTSDNGWLLGEHRLSGKKCAYEESIRVPLVVRVPGAAGGVTSDHLVLNNDLAPTLVELAGVTAGLPADGRSLLPLLADPTAPVWRRRCLLEHWPDTIGASAAEPPRFAAVRTASGPVAPHQLYVEYRAADDSEVSAVEHYDLADDPFQLRSLHDDPSPRRRKERTALAAWLVALRRCSAAACREVEDR